MLLTARLVQSAFGSRPAPVQPAGAPRSAAPSLSQDLDATAEGRELGPSSV